MTSAEPVDALILDLDDTLLDHGGSVRRALEDWIPELGGVPDDPLVALWFALEAEHFAAWQAGAIDFAEQRRRRLRDFLPALGRPVPAGDDDLDTVFDGYRRHYQPAWRAFPDVLPALTRLHDAGVPIVVLTNGAEAQQRAKVRAIGVEGVLVDTVTAEALGVAKPAPEAYRGACRRLGVEPSRVLHVGDSYDLDVAAARAAGLPALHLDRAAADPAVDPAVLHTLAALEPSRFGR